MTENCFENLVADCKTLYELMFLKRWAEGNYKPFVTEKRWHKVMRVWKRKHEAVLKWNVQRGTVLSSAMPWLCKLQQF